MNEKNKKNTAIKLADEIIGKQQKHQKKHAFGSLLRTLFVPYLLGLGERMESQLSFTGEEMAQVFHSIWEHIITEEEWKKGTAILDTATAEQWQKAGEEIIKPMIWEKEQKKKESPEKNL